MFRYRVRDPLGNVHAGTVEADSADEATQQLRQDGFAVLELDEDDGAAGGLFARRVKKSEVIYATSQLAIMVETGVALPPALEGVMQQEQNPTLKAVLGELKSAVEGGEDFSAALVRHPRLFDATFVSLVKAAESTGSMGAMLDRIARYMRKDLETRSKVRAAMAYPAVMMVLAVAVTAFLLTFVLPKFAPLFNRKGVVLPKPTVVMMAVSETLIEHWYFWLAGLVAVVVGLVAARRTPWGRQAWDGMKLQLPITGPISRKVTISRSIRTLSTMLKSGIGLLDAIELSAAVAGNVLFEMAWRQVAEEVTGGAQVHTALRAHALFPPMLVQMIAAGEQSGKLDAVLDRVGEHFDQEVETSVKTATSLIEPMMIAGMGFVVGGIALSLLLPIFQLSKPG